MFEIICIDDDCIALLMLLAAKSILYNEEAQYDISSFSAVSMNSPT